MTILSWHVCEEWTECPGLGGANANAEIPHPLSSNVITNAVTWLAGIQLHTSTYLVVRTNRLVTLALHLSQKACWILLQLFHYFLVCPYHPILLLLLYTGICYFNLFLGV